MALHRRKEFVDYLRRYGGDCDDYEAAEMIFGELVANAVLHAPGSIEVLVEWPSGRAMLYVSDEGPPIDARRNRAPNPDSEHGRGLLIVQWLSPSLTSVTNPGDGKTISAALPVLLGGGSPRQARAKERDSGGRLRGNEAR
jgi:anti-sigma regulatory factor (Ser/Thr protein kinase)